MHLIRLSGVLFNEELKFINNLFREWERRMKKHCFFKGSIIIAFGSGLFLAYCFPSKILIIATSLLLIVAGIVLIKR